MAKSKAVRASQWIVLSAGLLLGPAWPVSAAAGPVGAGEPRIGRAVRHGVSPGTLREVRVAPEAAAKAGTRRVLEPPPQTPPPATGSLRKGSVAPARPGPSAPDALLQFDGAATNDNLPFSGLEVIPPDANGAAGPNHYFQAINLVFRIFDKSGNLVARPAAEREPLGGSRRNLRDERRPTRLS